MATPRQTRQSQRTSTSSSSSSTVVAASPPPSSPKPSTKASSSSVKSTDPSTLRSLALKTKKRKSAALVGAAEGEASSSKKAARSVPPPPPTATTIQEDGDVDMDAGEAKTQKNVNKVVKTSEKVFREDGEISDDDPAPPPSPLLSTPTAPFEASPIPPTSATLPGMPPPTLISNGLPLATFPPHAFPPFPPSRPGSTPASSTSNLHFPPSLSIPPPTPAEPRFPPPSSAFLEAVNAGPVKIYKNKKGKASASMNDKASEKSDPVAEGAAMLRTTEENYGESRMLLLELLSWGVSPEYLVKSGLSREAVLVLFSDLKIRLPTNLPGPPPIYEVYDEPSPSDSPAVSRGNSGKQPSRVPSPPTASTSKLPLPSKPTPSNYVRAIPPGMPAPVAFSGGLPPPPPTLPAFAGSNGRVPQFPPPPTRSGKDVPPPAPFPNFPPTLSRSNSSQSEVISLISPPGRNHNVALSPDLSSIEAQRRALLVARKHGLEQQRKEAAAKQAAVDKYKKGKGKAVEAKQVEEKLEEKTPVEEEGEFDDQGAASLIEMELAKIGLELAGGMMECEEEKEIFPKEDNSSLELEDYDEDQDVAMVDPDGAVGVESNVLFAGLGTSSTESIKNPDDSPISSGEILEVTEDEFVPKEKKASTSKRPVALDFDSKPTTTLPAVAPSTHQHRKRRALVPDRPKRFVIELSDSESDEDDADHQALRSPSFHSGPSLPFASSFSSSSNSARRPVELSNGAPSISTPDPSSLVAISELDLEGKWKLEQKEQEIKRMTQLIAAMEAKQKSRSSSQQTKSNTSTPTLKSAVPLPLASSSALVTQAEAFLPGGGAVGEGSTTKTTMEPEEIGLPQGEREGSAEALRGAVEQLQEVKERMEEERDEFLEDLVASGEVAEGSAVEPSRESHLPLESLE
ncbi:hypothetical protein BDY24DRAFT_9322 [Mrakia frigida]|uniref:uncharacterized protein n=1 Tax=Mrakia frigida TaxID=29902 RepID=UPI003FCBFCA5